MTLLLEVQRKIINNILEVEKECSESNWDGYNAAPVKEESTNYAVRFMMLFPSWIPEPEVTADPDGCIAFDWMTGKANMLSISFYNNGNIDYAGLCGENKIVGSEKMGDTFPQQIADFIKEMYNL